MAEEKKSIFKKIGDAFSSRDEKEELAKAQAELEAAKKQAAEALAAKEAAAKAAAQATAQKLEKEKIEAAREKAKAEFEARKKEMEELAKKNEIIAEHTVQADETLSHIALKYYKHATKPYYMHIYEANKEVIGENPNIIRPGMVLKITVLPDELKE